MKDFFKLRELMEASNDWKSEPPEVHRELDRTWVESDFDDEDNLLEREMGARAEADDIPYESAFAYAREDLRSWYSNTPTHKHKSKDHKKLEIAVTEPQYDMLETDSYLIRFKVNSKEEVLIWDHGMRKIGGKPLAKKIAEYFERKLWEEEPTLLSALGISKSRGGPSKKKATPRVRKKR